MDNVTCIRRLLLDWAEQTRCNNREQILSRHAPDVLIYDVLPPLKYESAAAYRASWDDWHPQSVTEATFALRDLVITAEESLAFAHGLIDCGGTSPGGRTWQDCVRATFCLTRRDGAWSIVHQHISKPFENPAAGAA